MRLLALLVLLSCQLVAYAAPQFPALSGRVVDGAEILSADSERRISELSAAHEAATSNQLVVVTLPDLGGYTIEEYGYQLGRFWGIGQSSKNNGVLLIVAKAEHKIRIEVGYGLEGELTDAISGNIINTVITPQFKLASFDEGLIEGSRAIIAALGGQYKMRAQTARNEKEVPTIWFVLAIILMLFFRTSRGGMFGLLGGMALGSAMSGRRGGGGFSRGGGFSGGGGGFGGGGASGGW